MEENVNKDEIKINVLDLLNSVIESLHIISEVTGVGINGTVSKQDKMKAFYFPDAGIKDDMAKQNEEIIFSLVSLNMRMMMILSSKGMPEEDVKKFMTSIYDTAWEEFEKFEESEAAEDDTGRVDPEAD